MNRRTWWTALLAACGIAKAQTKISQPSTESLVENGRRLWARDPATGELLPTSVLVSQESKPKPVNNECPVCGTMAKPYTPTMPTYSLPNTYYEHWSDGKVTTRTLPSQRVKATNLVRCEWCNCAFWQDEEQQ